MIESASSITTACTRPRVSTPLIGNLSLAPLNVRRVMPGVGPQQIVSFKGGSLMFKRFTELMILMLALGSPLLCLAQPSPSECDFSRYKPLVLSHPLMGAAIKKVEPAWPPMGHGTGRVRVKILVDRKGNVTKACVVEGHPLLRASAWKAALEWKFKPNFGLGAKQKRKYIQSDIVFAFRRD